MTVMSVPAVLPRDLKVFEHSVVFIFQIYDTNLKHKQIQTILISTVLGFKTMKIRLLKKNKIDSEKKNLIFQSRQIPTLPYL